MCGCGVGWAVGWVDFAVGMGEFIGWLWNQARKLHFYMNILSEIEICSNTCIFMQRHYGHEARKFMIFVRPIAVSKCTHSQEITVLCMAKQICKGQQCVGVWVWSWLGSWMGGLCCGDGWINWLIKKPSTEITFSYEYLVWNWDNNKKLYMCIGYLSKQTIIKTNRSFRN